MSKHPKKLREKSKTRAWEQERRNRLNQCFNHLWEVLPIYDKSKPISKPDILIHATSTIKDLDEKLKKLLINSDNENSTEDRLKVSTDVIKKLQDRVKKLLLRNEQLANLLSNAGIKVPSECGNVKKFKKISKNDSTINAKQVAVLQKELEKENQEKRARNRTAKARTKGLKIGSKRKSKKQLLSSTNCLFLVSQSSVPNNQCFILSKTPTKFTNPTVMTNSLLVKGLIVSPDIKPSNFPTHSQFPGLSRGTLVLTDGTILPAVQAPRPLPVLPAIITNPVPTHMPTIIVVSSTSNANTNSSCASKITVTANMPLTSQNFNTVSTKAPSKDRLPVLRARPNITKTTQVNKVPIPALSSKYNKHICLDSKKSQKESKVLETKKKLAEKVIKNEAKKLKTSNETVGKTTKSKATKNENKNTGDVVIESVEEHVQLNQENRDNIGKSDLSSAGLEKQVQPPPTKNISDPPVTEDNTKISSKSHQVTNFISDPTTITTKPKQTKLDLDPERFANVEPVKTVCSSQQDINIPKPSRSEKIVSSANESVTSRRKECFEMSSGAATCLKQASKPFEDPNLTDFKSLETELSNDIFATFNVPPGCQNPESTSPTAAFLLAFPLVSSGTKVAEVIGDENSESQTGTPNLLQIGTMDISKPTQSYSESLTPNMLGFDNFSFFSNKENCGGYYNNFPPINTNIETPSSKTISFVNALESGLKNNQPKSANNMQCNNKASSNSKIEISAKDSGHNKFPNYHHDNNCVKEHIEKTIATSISHTNSNVLEMNNDIFSFKSISNENYCKQNNSGPMYTTKSSSYYPNYKNYNPPPINTQFVESKHYAPVYTSAGITNSFYNTFSSDIESRNFTTNYNEYTDYTNRKHFTNSCSANPQVYHKEKSIQTKIKPPQNKPINWMTTPSTSTATYKSDYFLPPFSNSSTSFSTIPSNSYFNSSVYNSNDHLNIMNQKSSDPSYGSYQRSEAEENQFSWSPNKMPQFLETTHAHSFVSSTLPTLVGDLALNNTPIIEQKNAKDRSRDNRNNNNNNSNNNNRKAGNCENQSGQSSFLSVSQLVEPTQENVPAKVSSRRNSGSRSKTTTPKSKRTNGSRSEGNKEMQKTNFSISVATNLFNESKQSLRNNFKHTTSSYSAEALIGNQGSGESPVKRNNNNNNSCQNNKTIVPSFFNENMISYFPSIEVSQDNNYSSQTYQSNSFSQNFTTFQNNSYSSNNYIPSSCPITSSYISTNNFMSNSNPQDFLGENANLFQNSNVSVAKEKCNFSKNYYRPPDKEDKNQTYSCKKAKKRPLNDNVLPSFDIHFFSMPGAINSPILPDDFHTTYLPPTTLYSCKNPLYSKPNTEPMPGGLIPPLPAAISTNKSTIQHPQMSPSVNSAGTSLTNFNLSTIFPEINKGPVQESFSSNRSKDYNNSASKSISMPSSLQIPFSNKY